MTELAQASAGPSGLRARLDAHLGGEAGGLPVVVEEFAPYDHVNVQIGLSAYLEAPGRRHELLGITGPGRHHLSFADLLEQPYGIGLGSVDLVNLPIGPDETLACVRFGIYLVEDAGTPVAILVRGPQEEFGLGSVRWCSTGDPSSAATPSSWPTAPSKPSSGTCSASPGSGTASARAAST